MAAVSERVETPAAESSDDFEVQVRHAQAELLDSVDRAGLSRDPYRFAVGAIVHTLGVFPAIVRRLENAGDPAVIERVEVAAAAGAAQRAAELARAYNRRTVLLTGAIAVVGVVIAALGGYLAGRNSTLATASAIEAAAVRDGPKAADFWLTAMRYNDGQLVSRACEAEAVKSDGGRRACGVGLWLEPPGNAVPRMAPPGK